MTPLLGTFTGRWFDISDTSRQAFCIEDIAHHLSQICRFNGACRQFYSVAQHSVIVSREAQRIRSGQPGEIDGALWGLLHDAAEAYVGDMTRPMQATEAGEAWRKAERSVSLWIAHWAQLDGEYAVHRDMATSAVRAADETALATELRDLMVEPVGGWAAGAEALAQRIEPWGPQQAKEAFLWRWWTLWEQRRNRAARAAAQSK